VKRVIGVPGDRIHLVNKQLWLNGHMPVETLCDSHPAGNTIRIATTSRWAGRNTDTTRTCTSAPMGMLRDNVVSGELVVPPRLLFRHGGQPRQLSGQPLLGAGAAGNIIGKAGHHFCGRTNAADGRSEGTTTSIISSIWRSTSSPKRAGNNLRLVEGYPLQ